MTALIFLAALLLASGFSYWLGSRWGIADTERRWSEAVARGDAERQRIADLKEEA
jgi:membrane protein DedA with SNARE-associated domain